MRVLSIPAGHDYTRVVWPSSVSVPADPTDPWWPHPALNPAWIPHLLAGVDLVHLHFGYEHCTPDTMSEWCRTLAAHRVPLLVTVHDLDNPNLSRDDQTHHHRLVRIVVEAADEVTTLTQGAAAVIERRFGRPAVVIPHPPLLTSGPEPTSNVNRRYVGVDLRNRRANLICDGAMLTAVARAVEALAGAFRVLTTMADRTVKQELRSRSVHVEHVEQWMSEPDLATFLRQCRVVLLPYSHGTHSGRVEACRTVGTRVLATDVGFYGQQWTGVTCVPPDALYERGRLETVLGPMLDEPLAPASKADLRRRLEACQAAHVAVARSLIGHPDRVRRAG